MSTAGYVTNIYAKATSGSMTSSELIDGAIDWDYSDKVELLDTTDFKDSNVHTRIAGLRDFDINVNGDFERTDTPQALLRTPGTAVYITLETDPSASSGSKGVQVLCLVESVSINAGVSGKLGFKCTLKVNGSIAAY